MKIYVRKQLASLFFSLLMLTSAFNPAQASVPAKTNITAGRDIIKEIIDVVGLSARFELQAADIDNAAAVIINGKRYILYNPEFLNAVNNASRTDWAAVSIIAHEIGHHLNGHTLSRTGSNPAEELEADEFSGFVLRKMGASLANAQAAISVLSEDRDSATHPGRKTRLTAISTGWLNADNQILAANKSVSNKPVQVREMQPVTENPAYPEAENPRLNSKFILTRVTFKNIPDEQFYITAQGNLVRVKNSQVEVIGKLKPTNHPEYPFMFISETLPPIFVSNKGIIYSQNGKKLGWLS